jgi:hypothetical protein
MTTGSLTLRNNSQMTTLSMPSVLLMNGSVFISQNLRLQSIDLTNVVSIAASLQIDVCPYTLCYCSFLHVHFVQMNQ